MLSVDLSIREADGQAVVVLRGEFGRADAPGVVSHLITAVAAFGPSVIVDLTGLECVGYSGLTVLLRVRKWTRRSGGDLLLAAPQPTVLQVLEATGLIDVFSVYRSVDEAARGVRQLRPPSPVPPPQPGPLSRPGRARPPHRRPCHGPARSVCRSRTCRSRRSPRASCGKRR